MMEIKAIETRYKGYRFRSRLEARWAVYFDAVGIQWEYEKEGYHLPSGMYLPDFWLPQVKMWAEVKPKEFNGAELNKAIELAVGTGHQVLLLDGAPVDRIYWAVLPIKGADQEYFGADLFVDYVVEGNNLANDGYMYAVYSGLEYPASRESHFWGNQEKGVLAARAARFEHGEAG